MICLHSPSCICIVTCGWLKCFIAAKGKTETIRKKNIKRRIYLKKDVVLPTFSHYNKCGW